MKLFTGWVMSAGLVFAAAAANAQVLAPVRHCQVALRGASDIGVPYAAMPQDVPVPRYGPSLLPPQEVYTVRPRKRVFAARSSAAARLRLHDCRD